MAMFNHLPSLSMTDLTPDARGAMVACLRHWQDSETAQRQCDQRATFPEGR